MNSAIGDILGELLKDSNTKEKLSELTNKVKDNIQSPDTPTENPCAKLDQKITLLKALCPVLGENFTYKAQKVIKALKSLKTIYEMEKSE